MFGLPAGTTACLFDMDGVVTQTALVHAAAWKDMFDKFLRQRAEQSGEKFVPFDSSKDYGDCVAGKPRLDGPRSFLESRDIHLPEGSPDDKPGTATIYGLSNEKNDLVIEKIKTDGVKVYDDTIKYIKAVRAGGLHTAIVSSSANTVDVPKSAGISDLFDTRVDAQVAKKENLQGKPAPDTFLAAARNLDVAPDHAAGFEDALAGVEAGHAGHFALTVGVARGGNGHGDALRQHGADVVVTDVADLLDKN